MIMMAENARAPANIPIPSYDLGQPIPDAPHAVSVSLPTWKAVVAYEEGEEWVIGELKTGYPRFVIHKSVTAFADALVKKHGSPNEKAIVVPSSAIAARFVKFLLGQVPSLIPGRDVRIVDLCPIMVSLEDEVADSMTRLRAVASAVIFPQEHRKVAKVFWQHTGEGISSRRAEFCHKVFDEGLLSSVVNEGLESSALSPQMLGRGPRRYQKSKSSFNSRPVTQSHINDHSTPSGTASAESIEYVQFVEERFGRNLGLSLAANAKLAVRRRIAGALTADVDLREALRIQETPEAIRRVQGFSEDDVYLYPSGMSAIFNTHRVMMATRGELKSVCFGFPYLDTLKILEKWGPGCLFYGTGDSSDLDDLEQRCKNGEKFLALFCEFPSNPLLSSPDLCRIRSLADRFDFAVVIDETIGNFLNVHVLPFADVVVSSLTKVFSGDCNVMGGSAVVNPKGSYYDQIRKTLVEDYEDNYWAEDAIYMERNSRNFVSRIQRINFTTEAIGHALRGSPIVKNVYYPKFNPSRRFYDDRRTIRGGYGGLLSVTFHSAAHAVTFFDALETAKGPSLGTNFTLSCPYIVLAHYSESDWVSQFGIDLNLVRISVGLEDPVDLVSRIKRALSECD